MSNLIFKFLTENNVPADELGKNWQIFEIIAIVFAVLPWIALFVYLLFLRKYRVRYIVNNEVVNVAFYKKNTQIVPFEYNGIKCWYTDEECTNLFTKKFITENIKLYGKNE